MKRKILFAAVLLFFCCENNPATQNNIPVVVEIKVFWLNPADAKVPMDDMPVRITHEDGTPVLGTNLLQATTDSTGVAVLTTDSEVLYPKNTYSVIAYYVNNRSATSKFEMPQRPNNGSEYKLTVEICSKFDN